MSDALEPDSVLALLLEESGGGPPLRMATRPIRTGATGGGQLWPTHVHRDHELLWAVEGVLTVRTPVGAHVVPSGLSLWIPSGVPHEVHAAADTTFCCSWLDLGPAPAYPRVTSFVAPPLLEDVLAHLMREDLSAPERDRAELFAADLLPAAPDLDPVLRLPRSADLRSLADAVLDDPAAVTTVEGWARDAGMSVRTLARRFRSETGMTLSQWRRTARVQVAMQVLARGEPVTRAARAAGFTSTPAFSAAFRQLVGQSPREFAAGARRRERRAGRP